MTWLASVARMPVILIWTLFYYIHLCIQWLAGCLGSLIQHIVAVVQTLHRGGCSVTLYYTNLPVVRVHFLLSLVSDTCSWKNLMECSPFTPTTLPSWKINYWPNSFPSWGQPAVWVHGLALVHGVEASAT